MKDWFIKEEDGELTVIRTQHENLSTLTVYDDGKSGLLIDD